MITPRRQTFPAPQTLVLTHPNSRTYKRKHVEAFRAASSKSPRPPERALNPVTEVRGRMGGVSAAMEGRPPRNQQQHNITGVHENVHQRQSLKPSPSFT
ncbi:hypothetical protein VZT92_013788 [Zoarces viviparus]|uniref:Uncharacterized protein n=1 Tax=Zoarces viviparus TaxID=48416 RepID=A0AAW1F5Q8_ZOAVI